MISCRCFMQHERSFVDDQSLAYLTDRSTMRIDGGGVCMATTAPHPTTTSREIVHDPRVLGGEAIIAGTRVPVQAVVLMHLLHGGDMARILRSLPTITAGDVDRALAYFAAHRTEIIRAMRANGVDEEAIRRVS